MYPTDLPIICERGRDLTANVFFHRRNRLVIMDADLVALFKGIGLDDKKAQETTKNKKLSRVLHLVIEKVCMLAFSSIFLE